MWDPEAVTAALRYKMLHSVSQGDENPLQIPSSLSLLGFVSARFPCLPETSTPLRSLHRRIVAAYRLRLLGSVGFLLWVVSLAKNHTE